MLTRSSSSIFAKHVMQRTFVKLGAPLYPRCKPSFSLPSGLSTMLSMRRTVPYLTATAKRTGCSPTAVTVCKLTASTICAGPNMAVSTFAARKSIHDLYP